MVGARLDGSRWRLDFRNDQSEDKGLFSLALVKRREGFVKGLKDEGILPSKQGVKRLGFFKLGFGDGEFDSEALVFEG